MTMYIRRGTASATTGLVFLFTLAGCGPLNVDSSPGTFPVPEMAASELKGGQSVAVENHYREATIVRVAEIGAGVDADLHQYTETAITLVEREFRRQGIYIRSGSKTVTLKISNVSYNYGWTITYGLNLTAKLGNGETVIVTAENSSPATAYRAVDGAIMRAVTRLLVDQEFQEYINE